MRSLIYHHQQSWFICWRCKNYWKEFPKGCWWAINGHGMELHWFSYGQRAPTLGPCIIYGTSLEHLHRHSVREPALKILDEVQLSNPVDPLEDWYGPKKIHTYQSPGGSLEHPINTVKWIYWLLPVFDWLDSLIVLGGLLSVVSHLFAGSVSVLWVGLERKEVIKTWMRDIFLQGPILSITEDSLMLEGVGGHSKHPIPAPWPKWR